MKQFYSYLILLCLAACEDTMPLTYTPSPEEAWMERLTEKTWGYYEHEERRMSFGEELLLHPDGTSNRVTFRDDGLERDTTRTYPQWTFYNRERTIFHFSDSYWLYQIRSVTDSTLRISLFAENAGVEERTYHRKED